MRLGPGLQNYIVGVAFEETATVVAVCSSSVAHMIAKQNDKTNVVEFMIIDVL